MLGFLVPHYHHEMGSSMVVVVNTSRLLPSHIWGPTSQDIYQPGAESKEAQ